jgi:ribonuclease BN (tRNA processing enzyme)
LLPNGRLASAAALGEGLIGCDPARHLVYATDLADTAENRARLTAFARNADVLYCEASFREADAARARRTGHLTARACGEIAAAAGVRRLVPFHFSRRYEAESEGVYSEVRAAFPGALTYAETAVEP